MVHGSSVTTSVHPLRRHSPRVRAAARRASTSACAVGSPVASRSLRPVASTAPSGPRTTAPTGTSSVLRARSPSSRASLRAESRSPRSTRSDPHLVEEIGETGPFGDHRQYVARKDASTGRQRVEFLLGDPEIGEKSSITVGGRVGPRSGALGERTNNRPPGAGEDGGDRVPLHGAYGRDVHARLCVLLGQDEREPLDNGLHKEQSELTPPYEREVGHQVRDVVDEVHIIEFDL